MCLMIHAKAGVGADLSDDWLRDFFTKNGDGFGFMYVRNNQLNTIRRIDRPERFIADWRKTAQYDRVIHLRMGTHGTRTLDNVHPYWVVAPHEGRRAIALMHNGILCPGNYDEKDKSDTWHFIRDTLKPLLTRFPELMERKEFENTLGEMIGKENRIALLDSRGNLVIANRDTGVEWKDMWMSNTYAWSAYKANPKWGYSYGGLYDYDEDWFDKFYPKGRSTLVHYPVGVKKAEEPKTIEEPVTNQEESFSVYEVIQMLDDMGYKRAAFVNYETYNAYAQLFGIIALWNLAEALLDDDIDEHTFIEALHDVAQIEEPQEPAVLAATAHAATAHAAH